MNTEQAPASFRDLAEAGGGGLAPAYALVAFWRDAGADAWFAKNAAFDDEFRERFLALHFAAARRECENWLGDPCANLALVLLLDQFPRNTFRGTAHMYATDPLARFYTRHLIDTGGVASIEDALKLFVCVPFIHSESLDDQRFGLELYRRYAPANMQYALEHYEIIRRFGRFPHRNAALGRTTTADEQAFLDQGGFSG